MDHLFVDPSYKLRDRWVQAFPAARVVREASLIGDFAVNGKSMVWTPIFGMSTSEARSVVHTVTSAGFPVVAMSATPQHAEAFRLLKAGAAG